MHKILAAAVLSASLASVACSGTDETAGADASLAPDAAAPGADAAVPGPDAALPGPDAGVADGGPRLPPVVAVSRPLAYDGVKGSYQVEIAASDDVGIASSAIYIGTSTAPAARRTLQGPSGWGLVWNSTTTSNGLTSLTVKVTDLEGLTTEVGPILVVVINGGQEGAYIDGNTNQLSVPADYPTAVELDRKNHWDNPAGVTRFWTYVDWELPAGQQPWSLEVSAGTGECPDNGTVIGTPVASTTSEIFLETLVVAPATGMHFVHVKPLDPLDHKGQALDYRVHVFLFP